MSVTVRALDADKLSQLCVAMDAWVNLLGKDRSSGIIKAARLLDMGLQRAAHSAPPRPNKGLITAEAMARGYRMNQRSQSMITGRAQAEKMLGGAKSAFFRIVDMGGGVKLAQSVGYTEKGRVTYARGGKFRRGANILTALKGQTKRPIRQLPVGVKRLNLQALTTSRALTLREKAAAGGYISTEFLTYQKFNGRQKQVDFVAKNKVTVGSVTVLSDVQGDVTNIIIAANVPGVAEVLERSDAINRGFEHAVAVFNQDVTEKLEKRFQQAVEGIAK